MNISAPYAEHLALWATGASVLPRQDCRSCGSLLFKGYANFLEIKCRSCKQINLFDNDSVKVYTVKPI